MARQCSTWSPAALTVIGSGYTGINGVVSPPSGAADDDPVYAVGRAGLAMAWTGSQWLAITPPTGTIGCDLVAIAGNTTDVYAAATCGATGAIWQLDAGALAWTVAHQVAAPLAALSVDSRGDAYAIGPTGGASAIGGAWTDDATLAGYRRSAR